MRELSSDLFPREILGRILAIYDLGFFSVDSRTLPGEFTFIGVTLDGSIILTDKSNYGIPANRSSPMSSMFPLESLLSEFGLSTSS